MAQDFLTQINQKLDLILQFIEEQKESNQKQETWNEKTDKHFDAANARVDVIHTRVDKIQERIDKVFQWMERMSEQHIRLHQAVDEFKNYQFQKNEELFEIVVEMRDDLKLLKRVSSAHEDSFIEFKKHMEDKSRHLSPTSS